MSKKDAPYETEALDLSKLELKSADPRPQVSSPERLQQLMQGSSSIYQADPSPSAKPSSNAVKPKEESNNGKK